jgi:3-dehydroquinate dehydratase type I
MRNPKICVAIVDGNIPAMKDVEPMVDLFELRIDLIGEDWQDIARAMTRPWIACNRLAEDGGRWRDSEARRIERLLLAVELGASIVDIELRTKNLDNIVPMIKKRAGCLISSHDFERTPPVEELKTIVARQQRAGADICKVVTTAHDINDNLPILEMVADLQATQIVSFAMGSAGMLSRVLSPLAGAYFTYASIATGRESAPGQVAVRDLVKIYQAMNVPVFPHQSPAP